MKGIFLAAVVALGVALGITSPAFAADDEVGTGQLRVLSKETQNVEVPLKHTSVDAQVSGFVTRVNVTQTFINPFKTPIEAVYVFPLPHDAAVDDMTMTIGKRVIKGIIKKREEAREIYEKAKAAGKTASLLDQERPNIFTQSIANIMPGDNIEIKISYVQTLKYEGGEYEFVFPMVVGPRYIPGDQVIGKTGGGWAPDTNQVPDASKITPPVLKPNQRSGHDIDVTVHLDAGVPFHNLRSTSHQIDVEADKPTRATVKLDARDTIPNKDLILRYNVLGDAPEFGVLTSTQNGQGFFLLLLAPKAKYAEKDIRPREIFFVVDSSGSQQGDPLAKSKEAVKRALRGLRDGDTFQVYDFNDTVSAMSPGPVPATAANVREAAQFIDKIVSRGGTRMLPAIQAALSFPPDPKRLRIVFMTTDGFIGNEVELIKEIHDSLGDARLFSLGVGSSVNRYLLDRMAQEGKGFAQFVRQDEPTNDVVEKFHQRIDAPVMTDIEVDWGGLKTADVQPVRVPDLFAGQPLVLIGRFTQAGEGTVRLLGKRAGSGGELSAKVTFPAKNGGYDALATMWARAKIQGLMDQMEAKGVNDESVKAVTNLGLEFRLVTKYTSFVAVEEKVRNQDGKPVTVQVPVEMPEGVSYEGVFGAEGDKMAEMKMMVGSGGKGGGYGKAAGGFVGSAGMASQAPAPNAPPPPMAMMRSPAKSQSAAAMDEAEETGNSRGPRLDPVAFLGVGDEAKTRSALQSEFRKAIGDQLKNMTLPSGKTMMIRITLATDGKVQKVEFLKDDVGKDDLKKILEKALAGMKLPAPGKEAAIVFYLHF